MHFARDRRAGRDDYYDVRRLEALKEPLKQYLKETGVGWMLKHRDLVELWIAAAGPDIAADTRVRGFRAGVLHVEVYSPARKAELEQFGGATLVRALGEAMPDVPLRRIRFHLAERPSPAQAGRDEEEAH